MPVPDVKTTRKEEKRSGNNACYYLVQTLEDYKGPVMQKMVSIKILYKMTKLHAQNLKCKNGGRNDLRSKF